MAGKNGSQQALPGPERRPDVVAPAPQLGYIDERLVAEMFANFAGAVKAQAPQLVAQLEAGIGGLSAASAATGQLVERLQQVHSGREAFFASQVEGLYKKLAELTDQVAGYKKLHAEYEDNEKARAH